MTSLSPAKQALLAQRLRRRTAATTIPPRPEGSEPPLSHAQERLWFLEQYVPGTPAYTVSCTARVTGDLDPDVLRQAVREVAARHESLRSRFVTSDDGLPRVVIDPEPDPEFRTVQAGSAEEARALVSAVLARPFDLAEGPLLRVLLIRLDPADATSRPTDRPTDRPTERLAGRPADRPDDRPGDHVLMLAAHHAVADGWSWDVVLNELFALHDGRPLAALPVQYGDYARWQRERVGTPAYRADVDYWRGRLAGVPPLELPTDLARPAEQTFAGAAHGFRLDATLSSAVRALAEAHGATPYMVLLAAFQALLGRWSGQSSFAVGSPVSGRGLPELDGLVGMFVNTLALRADLAGDPPFTELLARVRDTALDAFAHQELPFDQLVNELHVERDVSRPAVFQVMFALQNYTAKPVDAGARELTWFAADTVVSRFDLSLYLHEGKGGLDGTFVYNIALFHAGTVERMAAGLETLLRSAVAAPATRLADLDVLPGGERARLARFGTAPAPAPPGSWLLHELVAAQAARTPDAPAVVFGGERLSYEELGRRAGHLARRLRDLGVRPGDRVAVCLEQSAGLAVALLGVLRAGAAYVPLDPEQPAGRIAYMVGDAGVRTAITSAQARGPLPDGLTQVLIEEPVEGPVEGPMEGPVEAGVGPDDLAYVIYTSGTTGRPKGVAVQHREVVTYLAGVRERFAVEPGSTFALLQSLAFDFGVTTFYLALLTGGCLHLIPSRTSAPELAEYFGRAPADYLKITPSHLAALLSEAEPAALLPRRLLVLGGEASGWAWARELAALGRCAVVNHYGPTEATVGITTFAVDPAEPARDTTLPIGRPLPGARVQVLDERLRPVPVGVVGEIFLGGARLARGYLGKPALTADRFLPDPGGGPGARMYRTGDLGRWLPDGSLQFLGRRDLQVKVRGYRVELGEVESVLSECPGVAQAVADLRGDRLVGYLLPAGDAVRPPAAEVRAWLRDRLPDYMIPVRYVWLDHLPLKSHGKVDRAALPDPGDDRLDGGAAFVPPRTPAEESVAAVWAGVLGLARVGALDDFFELGGHSLLAMQVLARLRKAVPERRLTLMDLFKHSTVAETAALLDGGDDREDGLLHRLTPPRAATTTLVCAPYGGGSAVIYKPLADALPADWALYSIAVPGHELGEEHMPPDEVARACAEEILANVRGPLVLYGHCGLGVMIIAEIARRLEAEGRDVEAVYLGGILPFARPEGRLTWLRHRLDDLRGDQGRVNALTAAGLDVSELNPEELKLIVRNRRHGTRAAERYFTRLFEEDAQRLAAPVVAVAGERDPVMEYHQERYREWHVLSPVTACAVLDEAAHFFLKYRAEELAEIVTRTHGAITTGRTAPLERVTGEETWWLEGVSRAAPATAAAGAGAGTGAARVGGPRPSMRRFFGVAGGQALSIVGSALTEFAVPIWIYLTTGSLVDFALFSVLALVPGMLVAPLAGTIVDRSDRRRIMLLGDAGAGGAQLALGLLLWTGNLQTWHIYPLLVCLSVALAFQRIAYGSAVPQLVPKRFLGHANGVVGMINGVAQLIVPLAAAGLMAVIGLEGILAIDVISYAIAIGTLLLIRFPATMALRRRETMAAELVNGFRYSWGNKGFRRMVTFFAVVNLFMAALFLMISPLVLSSGSLADVGTVSFFGGLGVFAGGLGMAVWGGPRVRRFRGQLMFTLSLAVSAMVIGVRADLVVITAGVFGLFLSLTLLNGVYTTIVQVKIPQRYHGRVFALNQLVAFSTLPLGYAVVAPLGTALFEPMLADGGALADTVGRVIGTGEGRGIGFLYLLLGAAIALCVLVARRRRALWDFDELVPDALPDDVIGFEALRDRGALAKGEERAWTSTRS